MNLPALQLSNREKYVVVAGIALTIVILFYKFLITPVVDGRVTKRTNANSLTVQLEEMKELQAEYTALTGGRNSLKNNSKHKNKNFTLFSFLEKLAVKSDMKISYIKPSNSKNKTTGVQLSQVNMKFNEIPMEKLVSFLYGVEKSPEMIFVRGISITKTGKEVKLLNAILHIETVKR